MNSSLAELAPLGPRVRNSLITIPPVEAGEVFVGVAVFVGVFAAAAVFVRLAADAVAVRFIAEAVAVKFAAATVFVILTTEAVAVRFTAAVPVRFDATVPVRFAASVAVEAKIEGVTEFICFGVPLIGFGGVALSNPFPGALFVSQFVSLSAIK